LHYCFKKYSFNIEFSLGGDVVIVCWLCISLLTRHYGTRCAQLTGAVRRIDCISLRFSYLCCSFYYFQRIFHILIYYWSLWFDSTCGRIFLLTVTKRRSANINQQRWASKTFSFCSSEELICRIFSVYLPENNCHELATLAWCVVVSGYRHGLFR
jgi:hypothetical protein